MWFVFLGAEVCLRLPSDSTSQWTPLPLANGWRLQTPIVDFHHQVIGHARRTYKGFAFGAEGEYRLIGPGWQETDLYVAKSFKYLTLTVYDYYSFLDTLPGNLYEFSTSKTGHLFELMATLSDFCPLPLSLTGSWLFAGSDPDRSLYFELAWTQALSEGELGFVLGFTPHKGYYAPKAAIVNVGVSYLKQLKVSDTWKLPVSLALILNPEEKNLYLVAGISL